MFPLSSSPSHQLSNHSKTSSEGLCCVCIVQLCSAAMFLPLSSPLPAKTDHNSFNCEQCSYLVAPMSETDIPSDFSSKDEKNSDDPLSIPTSLGL